MRLPCPCCGATFALEAAINDARAREAVEAALRLPAPLGDLVLRYVAMFRPRKRVLTWDRAARLLNELLGPIKTGQVEYDGRLWPAPQDHWRRALEQMLDSDTLTRPLKGHGYLFKVVAGMAARAQSRREVDDDETKRRQPPHGGGMRSAEDVIGRAISEAGAAGGGIDQLKSVFNKGGGDGAK